MRVLFVLPAANVYDNQGRVTAWKHTPCSRASMGQLKELTGRLKELGPHRVIGSDLDHDSVWLLSRKLRIPYEEWSSLRRFNAGKHHGAPAQKFNELWNDMGEVWAEKPDVPVKGGDSLTSYRKRMTAAKERLAKLEGPVVLVVTKREVGWITGLKTDSLEHGRVYEWELKDARQ